MARDWNRSSVDWEASREAGGFVMKGGAAMNVPKQHTRSRSRKPVKLVKQRPYQPSYYETQARRCVSMLQQALGHAREAGAPYTVERIRLALSSARGAVRNAGYRVTRAGRRG